tara:strand:- start:721 stop:996 length:276 start_codon:yes stop_codon:yes gene_type:complete
MENRTWGKDVGLSDAIGHLTLKFLSGVLGLFLGFALASLRRERLESMPTSKAVPSRSAWIVDIKSATANFGSKATQWLSNFQNSVNVQQSD